MEEEVIVKPEEGKPEDEKTQDRPAENELAEWKRKAEEAERKIELGRRENDMLREQRLREMAITPAPTVTVPDESDGDLDNEFVESPTKTVRKLISKEAAKMNTLIQNTARNIYAQETKKAEAIKAFPDLRKPQSDFFKKVSYYMDMNPNKYQDPEGLFDTCTRVAYEMGISPKSAEVEKANETVRQGVSSTAAQVASSGTAPAGDVSELDQKGILLAKKLGIDPKDMAKRLGDMTGGKGEYAPAPGKTGKATI